MISHGVVFSWQKSRLAQDFVLESRTCWHKWLRMLGYVAGQRLDAHFPSVALPDS
jgi:hypothetical protein